MYTRNIEGTLLDRVWMYFTIPSAHLIEVKSQRENWFVTNKYIAEFYACISNIGFLYVGLRYSAWPIFLTGILSMLSHTVPYRELLLLDKIGAGLAASYLLAYHHQGVIANSHIVIPFLLFAGSEVYLSRRYNFSRFRFTPHVLWHIGAAIVSGLILSH